MRKYLWHGLLFGLIGAVILTGCGSGSAQQASSASGGETTAAGIGQNDSGSGQETAVVGTGTTWAVEGEGAAVSGGTVTISSGGTYRLGGTMDDGQVLVDAGKEDEITLILDGLSISSSTSSAICGIQSGQITIWLEEGTENTVSDAVSYVYGQEGGDEPDAAIFSKDDLVLAGSGSLTVNGNYQNGIKGKDDVAVRSGTYRIEAVNDAIRGKDSVEIEGGTFTIAAGGDGIQSNNDADLEGILNGSLAEYEKGYVKISGGSLDITAGKKGILAVTLVDIQGGEIRIESGDDAVHSNGDITVLGGTLNLSSGDDAVHGDNHVAVKGGTITVEKSYEGIEGLMIDIEGGLITVKSEDDGLNAAGGNDSSGNTSRWGDNPFSSTEGAYIKITGGELIVDAGGDGIDSNGDLFMEGGNVRVEGPVSDGNGTLDFNGTGTISGGTFIGTGSAGMLQAFSAESVQPVIVVYYGESQSAGTAVTVLDSSQKEIASVSPAKGFTALIFSSPELKDGDTYQIQTGEDSVEITLDGILNQSGNAPGGFGRGMGGEDGRMRGGGREAGAPEGGTAPERGRPSKEELDSQAGGTPPEDRGVPKEETS